MSETEAYEKAKIFADETSKFFKRLQDEKMVVNIKLDIVAYSPASDKEIFDKVEILSPKLKKALEATIEDQFERLMGRVAFTANTLAIVSLKARMKAEGYIEDAEQKEME